MTQESNFIVLKSVFNKTPGMEYKIVPVPDKRGVYAPCVRKVDSNGDMILSEDDKKALSRGAVFIPEGEPITVKHNTTFDLSDPIQAAQWEAIKNSKLIAKERSEKDTNGVLIIDGQSVGKDRLNNPTGHYGVAELYIERPGKLAQARVNSAKLIHEAQDLVFKDSLAHQVMMCKLFEKNMEHAHPSDVEDFLLTQAQKYPEKVIKFYTAEESTARLLLIMAIERGVVQKKQDGLYYAEIKLGSNMDFAVDFVKASENKSVKEAIKLDTYPELEKKKK